MNYDVIIVGAGSMGMAAGYYFSKKGKKTLLIDSYIPPHNSGSHHGETRIIRYAYAEGEEYVPFILRAKELWSDLEKETQKQLFLPTGVLSVGDEKSDFIQNTISSSNSYSLPLDVMNASDIHRRWPGITIPGDFIGCFEPTSGVLKCEEIIKAYQQLAEIHGAAVLTNSRVTDITVHNGNVTVKTDHQTFHAEALVLTTGAWAQQLLSILDLKLPLSPVRKTFAWFEAEEQQFAQQHFPVFAFETPQGLYYGFPSIDGAGLKVGRHDGGEPFNLDEPLVDFGGRAGDKADLVQFLRQYMPAVHQLKFGKTCKYTMTPDEKFIIDLHPKYPNVAIAAGFSGHGFKFSSAVGEALCHLIISGKNDVDISQFSIKRFEKN